MQKDDVTEYAKEGWMNTTTSMVHPPEFTHPGRPTVLA